MTRLSHHSVRYVLAAGVFVGLVLGIGLAGGPALAAERQTAPSPFKGLVLAESPLNTGSPSLAARKKTLQPFWMAKPYGFTSSYGSGLNGISPFAVTANPVGSVDTDQILALDALEPAAGLDEGPLGMAMSPRLRLQGDYNRVDADDLKAPGIGSDYSGHEFRLGFSYKLK